MKIDNFWHFPTVRNMDSGQPLAPVGHLFPSVVRAGHIWGHMDMVLPHLLDISWESLGYG